MKKYTLISIIFGITLGISIGNFYTVNAETVEETQCESPYVLFENQCVDPVPPCENPVPNSMFCVDKIENGEKFEQFNFECYPGWMKEDDNEEGEKSCKNPCPSPLIPYNGTCVDPVPPCKKPPKYSIPSSCVDKMAIDGSITENYNFKCKKGYDRRGNKCIKIKKKKTR